MFNGLRFFGTRKGCCCGCTCDPDRGTGRTTEQVFDMIAAAYRNKHCWLLVADHSNTRSGHTNLRVRIQDTVSKLGLQHFHFRAHEMCFGEPRVERPSREGPYVKP